MYEEKTSSSSPDLLQHRIDLLSQNQTNKDLLDRLDKAEAVFGGLLQDEQLKHVDEATRKNIESKSEKVRNTLIKQKVLPEYLYLEIGKWLDSEILRLTVLEKETRENMETAHGRIKTTDDDKKILDNTASSTRIHVWIRNTEENKPVSNLAEKELNLAERILIINRSLKSFRDGNKKDIITALADAKNPEKEKEIIQSFHAHIKGYALLLWASTEDLEEQQKGKAKSSSFAQETAEHYLQEAGKIRTIRQEREARELDKKFHSQSRQTWESYTNILRSSDRQTVEAFAKTHTHIFEEYHRDKTEREKDPMGSLKRTIETYETAKASKALHLTPAQEPSLKTLTKLDTTSLELKLTQTPTGVYLETNPANSKIHQRFRVIPSTNDNALTLSMDIPFAYRGTDTKNLFPKTQWAIHMITTTTNLPKLETELSIESNIMELHHILANPTMPNLLTHPLASPLISFLSNRESLHQPITLLKSYAILRQIPWQEAAKEVFEILLDPENASVITGGGGSHCQ